MEAPLIGEVGLLGLGALGRALTGALVSCGFCVATWNRSARAGLDVPGATRVPLLTGLGGADVLVLCVHDDAIGEVAERAALALTGAGSLPRVVLHTSGCRDERALAPFARRGAACGWFHPLCAVVPGGVLGRGVPIGIGGEPLAVATGRVLAERLEGAPLLVRRTEQARYHAAAALAASGTIAVAEMARALLEGALVDGGAALSAIRRLVASAAENLAESEPARALTGPAVRHDLATIAAHVEALGAPDLAARRARLLFDTLAPVIVELAAKRPGTSATLVADLERAFGIESPPTRGAEGA